MVVRRLGPTEDTGAVLALAERIEAATGVPPFGESKFVDLQGMRRGIGVVLEAETVEGYVHVLHHGASDVWEMEVAAGPTVDASMLAVLVAEASRAAGDRVLWWTFGESGVAVFARQHFPTVRELRKLVGPLPPAEEPARPEGIEIRPFRPGRDEAAWLAVNNAAFVGHPENGAWERADLEERKQRPWFDARGFRLAWAGERLAGFCWTKRHNGNVGEIHIIAVDPALQGKGIGRAIVLEALHYLSAAGCEAGMLYVDAANRSALRLYQSLGFGVERVDRCVEVPKGWPHEAQ